MCRCWSRWVPPKGHSVTDGHPLSADRSRDLSVKDGDKRKLSCRTMTTTNPAWFWCHFPFHLSKQQKTWTLATPGTFGMTSLRSATRQGARAEAPAVPFAPKTVATSGHIVPWTAQPINESVFPSDSSKIRARLSASKPLQQTLPHHNPIDCTCQRESSKGTVKLQSADRCLCGLSASSSRSLPSQLAERDHWNAAVRVLLGFGGCWSMETRRGTSERAWIFLSLCKFKLLSALRPFHLRGFPPEGSGRSGKLAMLWVFPPEEEELMVEHPKEPSVYSSARFCRRTRSRGGFFLHD